MFRSRQFQQICLALNLSAPMSTRIQAVLDAWSIPLGVDLSLCLTAIFYVVGWFRVHKFFQDLIPVWRLAAFLGGLLCIWIAIGSPLAAFDDISFSVHMVQHLLLIAVAPPLILLGAPVLPILTGIPKWLLRSAGGQLLRWGPLKRLGHFVTNPAVCWIAATLALLGWHVPAAFELALRSEAWHEVEHACFFTASFLFWWPVIQPFPSFARWPQWSLPVYLFIGMLPGGALAAFLTFCDRVPYQSYASGSPLFGFSPLEDQIFGAALMWVAGTIAYVVPAVLLVFWLLSIPETPHQGMATVTAQGIVPRSCNASREEIVQ
jgi:cytochrome c oxidase assembly factor CtaG